FPGGALRLYMYATRESLVAVGFVDYDGETADPSTGRSFVVISDPNGLPVRIQAGDDVVWCAQQADPFGPLEVASHASVEYNLRWPGHYFDRETGLHDNRHRSYDPTLGRYLQPDPIGYAGSPVNLYAYCGSPLTQVDLLGLQCSHSEEEAQGHAPDGRENPPEQDASAAKPTREQLAASEGTSDEHVEARKSVARDFYAKHCPEMSENQIDSHVACIDTTKPVKVVRIPPDGAGPNGDQLNTWVAPGGRPGQYFTPDANAQPDQLGINSRCIAPAQDNQPPRICPREQQTFTADPNTPATGLQSTAAPADDTWSVPGGRYSPEQGDLPSSTGGGGTQVMVPRSQQTGFSESD
ncbi:MAG TPA: RHS repeat-associated core domain-containing protein, partial [Polyangiaceae bacterium]|nr:RHS repeat-associated core domain-containing protein [Polyangiaceae bacterium]